MKRTASLFLALALLPGLRAIARDDSPAPYIGTTTRTEAAMIGIMYDMKQDQQRHDIPMDPRTFLQVLANFLDNDWDEGVISKYYRVSRPLYTTELNFDRFNADIAPKAFGVDKYVKPRLWMAWYKAQVSPPVDGLYRFVGFADNYLAVAVDNKTCLVACLSSSPIPCKWAPPPDGGTSVTKGTTGIWGRRDQCIGGDWMEMKAGRIYDIDIIFGEVPGGETSCFLGIQRKGVPLQSSGHGGLFDVDPFQLARSVFSLPSTIPWKATQ